MISYTEQTCLSGFPTASTWVRSLVKSSCLHSVASSWATVRTDGRLQLQDKSTVWHGQRSMEVHTKPTHQFNQDQHSPVRAQWVKRHGRVKERVRWRWGWVNKMLWAIHFDLYVKKKQKNNNSSVSVTMMGWIICMAVCGDGYMQTSPTAVLTSELYLAKIHTVTSLFAHAYWTHCPSAIMYYH